MLITDSLFRAKNLKKRREFIDLVDSIKNNGGEYVLFSSQHFSGERLDEISGIAAILRFPLNMDYLEEEEDTT